MKPTLNLKEKFPNTINTIITFMDLDKDFYQLCKDFEEITEMMKYLEKSKINKLSNTINQIEKYKQLQSTLITEINNFITEENITE